MSDNLIPHLTHSNESRIKNNHSMIDKHKELFNFIDRKDPRGLKEILQSRDFLTHSLNVAFERVMSSYNPNCENTKEILISLLSFKADPDSPFSTQPNKDKRNNPITALTLAAQENDIKLARILIQFNAKLKENNNKNLLLTLINNNKGDITDMVYLFIKSGINYNYIDSEGNTPLILSTIKGINNIVKVLLECGADIDHKNVYGNTALHYAIMNCKPDIIKTLLEFKPKLNIPNKIGFTAIELGTQSTRTDIYTLVAEEYNKKRDNCDNEHGKSEDINNSYLSINSESKDKDKNNNILSNTQNINNFISHNLSSNKYKNAKLQKLMLLQERKNEKDKKLSINNIQNSIEVPFNFQTNSDKKGKNSQLHTFIKIQSTPILHIDISDESKQDNLIMASNLEEMRITNLSQLKKINSLEIDFKNLYDENVFLKSEINRYSDELNLKEKFLGQLNLENSEKDAQYNLKLAELEKKLEYINREYQFIQEKNEKLENELYQLKSRDNIISIKKDINKKEYLEKKFSTMKYDEKYIIKCLQKDILDFQEYTKDQIKKTKATQEELIKLIQESVNECMPDYEVKLYGSHATNLCLQWSDLDVVLVNKRNYNVGSYNALQGLYINILEKSWKKSIKLIDSAVIPIIKITSTEQFNNMHIDISLQDSKHYGLKCVDLVRSFMKEYESLEPLIFALKNILKNANLNDPYTGGLSSYGLILMVVSFLQSQQENKKSIKINDGNLGRMFLEFLWYYGLMFDHTKYVIYAYPTSDGIADKDSINFLYNMQAAHELIIVDPLSKSNNVARSTYQFVNIKMAFMIGFVVSHEECECGCHYNLSGDECSFTNGEHCILKRIFSSVKRFNANNGGS